MTAQCQKEAHTSTLLSKFKMKCIIFTQELESCFQGTTHMNTLFTLKLDLNVGIDQQTRVVFSGAGRVSMKSYCLDQQLLSNYNFLTTVTSMTGFVRNSRRLSTPT